MKLNKSLLKEIGEGVVEKAVDLVLVIIYFNLEAHFIRNRRHLVEEKIGEDLENFDYQKLKRSIVYLKNKGLINVLKDADSLPKITCSGEKRLKSILPFYDEKRTWDGKIYLVTYDIPEFRSKTRDYLRDYLKKISCGRLQQSVWVTPYNPTNLIKKFVEEHNLASGLILVSSIGKNGTVGQLTLSELMEMVYDLSGLNKRYFEFVYRAENNKAEKLKLIFLFLSILKDDPQLPFSLLPKDWAGEEAYKIFKKLSSNSLEHNK